MTRHKPTPDDLEPNAPPEGDPPDSAAATAEQPADIQAAPEASPAPAEAALQAELAETKDRLLRALAETENLRRRSLRDLQDAHKYAITNFARELLEVADNLSRALDAVPARARDEIEFVKNLADGIAMTEKALLTSFERHQIETVDPTALSVQEQVSSFRDAALIVGVTGSGLVNAIFSRSAHVVEVQTGTKMLPAFYYLAAAKGLPYDYVGAPPDQRGLSTEERLHEDLLVDTQALDRLLGTISA